MKNYHETSSLLPPEEIERLNAAFDISYSAETAFPADQVLWTPQNKAKGHCAVVTLVVQDLYRGLIAHDQETGHTWNILPDKTEQDFTRSQYSDGTRIQLTTIHPRERILFSPQARRVQTLERYDIFRAKVTAALSA